MFYVNDYIKAGRSAFLVGIGGVSMCALADMLKNRGVLVRGSDMRESDNVLRLRREGIEVITGHSAENIAGADCVIRTAAAHDDNPEVRAARAAGIPVFERSEAWGAIMEGFSQVLCIAGTHGKTTTTSMAVQISMEAGLDPTAMIGGVLPSIGSEHRIGGNELFIAEADEYMNSFLRFKPTIAAILNIEKDHPDFYRGLDDIMTSFRTFAGLIPEDGTVIVRADDPNAMDSVKGIDRRVLTFGIGKGHVRAENIETAGAGSTFDIVHPGGLIPITLRQPGRHNIYNALAAAACALELGVDGISISRGLAAFPGVRRRFEFKGVYNGADIYDDYAHHPSELRELLNTCESMEYDRIIAVFQPHTYSRTKAFFNDFAEQLRRPDRVILPPIFAAREDDDGTVSSASLAGAAGNNCEAVGSVEEAAERLRGIVREGDLVLTIGAGEAYRAGEIIITT
jgi:UDP-N-acetylmuramate--alanine ligase